MDANNEKMIEEAAKAMLAADDSNPDTWDGKNIVDWDLQVYRTMARAALAVFEKARTPTGRSEPIAEESMRGSWTIREDENDFLDEVLCFKPEVVHLERIDNCAWWLGITFDGGTEVHVNVGAINQRSRPFANYSVDDDSPEGTFSNRGVMK